MGHEGWSPSQVTRWFRWIACSCGCGCRRRDKGHVRPASRLTSAPSEPPQRRTGPKCCRHSAEDSLSVCKARSSCSHLRQSLPLVCVRRSSSSRRARTSRRRSLRIRVSLGQSYARVVQEYLDGSRSVLEGLAAVPAVRAPFRPELKQADLHGIPQDVDVERRASIVGVIKASHRVLSVLAASVNGDVYMIEPYAKQVRFPITNQPDIIARVLSTGQPAWSDVIIDLETRLPTVILQLPVTDDLGCDRERSGRIPRPRGARTSCTFNPAWPNWFRHAVRQPRHTRGVSRCRPDHCEAAADRDAASAAALAGKTGSFAYYNPLTDQNELGTAVRLDNGWFVMITRTQAEAFEGLNRTVDRLLIVLGVFMVLLLVAGFLLAGSIARAVGRRRSSRGGTGLWRSRSAGRDLVER